MHVGNWTSIGKWSNENRAAIASYNERVEADAVFSDGVRRF